MKINILVLGCGGDIGQSIGKILNTHPLTGSITGTDISDETSAIFIFDHFIKVPPISNSNYQKSLQEIIEKNKIDIIIPVSEPELRYLTDLEIDSFFLDKKLICPNLKSRQIGFDKYETSQFLKASGLPFPETILIEDYPNYIKPIILKSRKGAGSKSLFIIKNKEDFDFQKQKNPGFIVQELLEDDEDEFTCGLFRSKNKEVRTIIYNRKLADGASGFGFVVKNEEIDLLLNQIAEKIDLVGSINVQLKLSSKGPCVFEINPRFSGTVKFRHMMGYQDLIWTIQDSLDLPISDYTAVEAGRKFYRGYEEYIL